MTDSLPNGETPGSTVSVPPQNAKRGTGPMVVGIILTVLCVFFLPRGLALLVLSIVQGNAEVLGASLFALVIGVILLAVGIPLIVRGVRQGRAYRAGLASSATN